MIPPMTDTHLLTFHRATDESPQSFATRLGDLGRAVAADDAATTVVVFVDDGEVARRHCDGVPRLVRRGPAGGGASRRLVAGGRRRARHRAPRDQGPRAGPRRCAGHLGSPSCARAFARRSSPMRSSTRTGATTTRRSTSRAPPGTCHYEQLAIERVVRGDAPPWDGVGLLSFASADDYTNGLFDGAEGERAIYEDIPKFLDLERGETIPTSELVFRDRDDTGERRVFTGGTAVITGGGSGLGRALVFAFADEGMRVIVADIELGNAEKVAGELPNASRVPRRRGGPRVHRRARGFRRRLRRQRPGAVRERGRPADRVARPAHQRRLALADRGERARHGRDGERVPAAAAVGVGVRRVLLTASTSSVYARRASPRTPRASTR